MGTFIVILSIELILGFVAYIIFSKINITKSILVLVILSSSIGLIGGWYSGYRMAGSYILNNIWNQTNKELQETRGSEMSELESQQLYNQIISNHEFYNLCHKNAAIHAIPAFFIVFVIIFSVARKQRKTAGVK
jgi:uncharacterized protein YneF (UPF0154 family)